MDRTYDGPKIARTFLLHLRRGSAGESKGQNRLVPLITRPNPPLHDWMPRLAAVPAGLDDPAVRVLLVADGKVDGVQAVLLALVEDVVDVVSEDAAVHVVDVGAAVVAQPDGGVVGARHAAAVAGGGAALRAQSVQVVLALDEVLALLGLADDGAGAADDGALVGDVS